MLNDNKEEARDLSVVLTKLEIFSSSRKERKKGFGKKVKGENFGGEVGFRIYDVKKIEEDKEEENGKEEQIYLKEIL